MQEYTIALFPPQFTIPLYWIKWKQWLKCLHHVTKDSLGKHTATVITAHECLLSISPHQPSSRQSWIHPINSLFLQCFSYLIGLPKYAMITIVIFRWAIHIKCKKKKKNSSASHIHTMGNTQKWWTVPKAKPNNIIKSNRSKIKINRAKPKQILCCCVLFKSKAVWLCMRFTKALF